MGLCVFPLLGPPKEHPAHKEKVQKRAGVPCSPHSAAATFCPGCLSESKPKKRNGMNWFMFLVVIYLILLTVGTGMLVMTVLKLQEQLRALVIYPHNETLATEGSWSSFLQSIPPPAGDAPRLQILQTQLTQICARQEQLLRRVDNCTQIPGPPGPQGPPGIKGETGRKGDMGMKGDMGLMGPPGARGHKGDLGMPGSPGVAGVPGLKGDQGQPGTRGLPGLPGAAGSPGAKGEPGSPGLTGPTGPAGSPGSPGAEGLKGSKGDTGLQGQKGTKGESGFPGPAGLKGEKGSRGLEGSRGAPGIGGQKGEPGAKGSSGLQGAKGAKGEKGESMMSVRIIGSRNRGRAEIFYSGVWGTICDDDWDNSDATVFCRMLGYSSGSAVYNVGGGTGTIWLDNVACKGSEFTLWDCGKNTWGSHNCNHNEDAGVNCS
uniref:SRCR domain-containing protein n=1 Tax=Sus scrofa TaxID=9823 RepID=A0A8D0PA78_PIG